MRATGLAPVVGLPQVFFENTAYTIPPCSLKNDPLKMIPARFELAFQPSQGRYLSIDIRNRFIISLHRFAR